MQNIRMLIACLFAFALSVSAADKKYVITVEAGEFDRRGAVVTFQLPQDLEGLTHLVQGNGKPAPVQVETNSLATFQIEEMKKGTRLNYEPLRVPIESSRARSSHPIQTRREDGKVAFNFGEATTLAPKKRQLLAYQAEPGAFPREDIKPVFRRGGYLHPIFTLSGRLVTDDFPANHVHHHGVWWAWTNTEFDGRKPDFWNMGDAKGRVEFESLDDTWSGPVHAGFRSRHRFIDLTSGTPVNALNESWQVTAYAPPSAASHWFFDLVSEQHCATTNALKLPIYRYGGVGVRGNWAWNGKDKAEFLTSDGETDRDKGNTARGRWCYMGGQLNGAPAGLAIMCHPENFRAPQPMRLHPTEPFFNFAPQQAGDMEIKPGETYRSRYRFVVLDGPPVKAELDRLWNDYAHPPVVRVVAK